MIEAAILTGGSSRRMGSDKASLLLDGEPILDRILRLLTRAGIPSTVLGPQGLADLEPGAGPLAALAAFEPKKEYVLACSCDLPLFDARLAAALHRRIATHQAAIPIVEGRLQPLCALYRADAFHLLRALDAQGERRIFAWLEQLNVLEVDSNQFASEGIHPKSPLGANTPEAWSALLAELKQS